MHVHAITVTASWLAITTLSFLKGICLHCSRIIFLLDITNGRALYIIIYGGTRQESRDFITAFSY